MGNVSAISTSALQAFSAGQQVTANNLANVNTDIYKAQATTYQSTTTSGVTANITSTQDNVDISKEAVNLISNSQNFKANLKVLKASDEMTQELLNIKA